MIKGMTWGYDGIRGDWTTEAAQHSLKELQAAGFEWITLAVVAYQEHPQSEVISFRDPPTVADEELVETISACREMGLKVVLKPIVNCRNGVWRAHISFFDHEIPGEPGWKRWFDSYTAFILHYAEIAERTGCELYCVGCELVQSDRRAEEWRDVIRRVRGVYRGLVTYNCDKFQEEHVAWWDAVDVISSSGYYAPGEWEERIATINRVTERFDKPFLFMEAGCMSRSGAAERPNDWSQGGAPDPEEQCLYVRGLLDAGPRIRGYAGFMLWDWPVRLYSADEAVSDGGYCLYGKPALELLWKDREQSR